MKPTPALLAVLRLVAALTPAERGQLRHLLHQPGAVVPMVLADEAGTKAVNSAKGG